MPASRMRFALILGALVAFAPLSIDVYLPAFPAIGETYGAAHGPVQLTLAFYLLGLAFGQLIYGPLSDAYGRRRPVMAGIALYIAGSLLCAVAPTIDSLIAFRLLQALGGCAGMVIARAVVRDLYSGADAARFFSLLMLVLGLAPILGPVGGGLLLRLHGWQTIFVILGVFGLACLVAVARLLPETLPRHRRRTGGLKAAATSYVVLARDLRFLRFAFAGGFGMAGLFAYIAGSPFVFIDMYGIDPERFGLIFGGNAAGFIAASQLSGLLVGRISPLRLLKIGYLVEIAACIVLCVMAVTGAFGAWGLIVPLFFAVGSLGLISPNAFALALQPHPEIAGAASALAGTIQFSCGALIGAAVGASPEGTALPLAFGFAGAVFVGGAMLFGIGDRPDQGSAS
jgi:MFS transporter, DHA1 family, multidrug resistance protein